MTRIFTLKTLVRVTLLSAAMSAIFLTPARVFAMKVDCEQNGPVSRCCAETGYCCIWTSDNSRPSCTGDGI